MPFNSSTPILYYNKDAFAKAGLDPAKPPQTWKQVEDSRKLIGSGEAAKCGFSTGGRPGPCREHARLHDQPFATKRNGFDGLDAELLINREFGVKHISQLAAWQKDKSTPMAAGPAADELFSGECAIIQSLGLIGGSPRAQFKWGAGMPARTGGGRALQEELDHRRRHPVGHEGAERAAAASESRHRPVPQVRVASPRWWRMARHTGYPAISNPAVRQLEEAYHFVRNPDAVHRVRQLTGLPPAAPAGLRLARTCQDHGWPSANSRRRPSRLGRPPRSLTIEGERENVFGGIEKRTAGPVSLRRCRATGNEALKELAAQQAVGAASSRRPSR